MNRLFYAPLLTLFLVVAGCQQADTEKVTREAKSGPIRVLFLGHEAELHPSDLYTYFQQSTNPSYL